MTVNHFDFKSSQFDKEDPSLPLQAGLWVLLPFTPKLVPLCDVTVCPRLTLSLLYPSSGTGCFSKEP